MSDTKPRGRIVETRRVSDEEIDLAIASLVGAASAPDVRANVVRRIGESQRGSRVGVPLRGPVVVWRAALAGAMLLVLAVSLWVARGPGSSSPSTDVARAAKPADHRGHEGTSRRGSAEPEGPGQVAGVEPPAMVVHENVGAGREGGHAPSRRAAAGHRLGDVIARTGIASSAVEPVDLLPDLAPLELTALAPPQPLVITPVVVEPIEIPDLTIPPPAGDPGDVKRNSPAGEPSSRGELR